MRKRQQQPSKLSGPPRPALPLGLLEDTFRVQSRAEQPSPHFLESYKDEEGSGLLSTGCLKMTKDGRGLIEAINAREGKGVIFGAGIFCSLHHEHLQKSPVTSWIQQLQVIAGKLNEVGVEQRVQDFKKSEKIPEMDTKEELTERVQSS
ncbi:hypothetical protein NQZ68_037100 [Dissostichus eleginoides]|nr:hypothetical protein NQZ68_037100 [Dissostichus eleginoides]